MAEASTVGVASAATEIADHESLSAFLAHWGSERPDATAVVSGPERLTWSGLCDRVERCAAGLAAIGVRHGTVVAMLAPQCWEFVVTYLALDQLEAVFLGLNTRHQPPEIETVLNDARPSVLVTVGEFNGRDYLHDVMDIRGRCPSVQTVIVTGGRSADELRFEDLLSGDRAVPASPRPVSATEAACIVYTSGTSGRPKGAILPRRGLLSNHKALAKRVAHAPFRAQCDHPIDHVGGLDRLYLVVILGGTLVLAERFRPEDLLRQIAAERITYWMGEATQFIRCREYISKYALPNLRVVQFVGALPEDLLAELARISPTVTTGYGMTECCSAVIRSTRDMSLPDLARGVIGPLLDSMSARIVDAEARVCRTGEVGELQVRSACLFTGYLGMPEETRKRFSSDGWFATGDLFAEDRPGRYRFVGRLGDVFSCGGYNIHPREIEAAACAHPWVEEAALIGVPDATYGHRGWLYYTSSPVGRMTPEALKSFMRKRIANYKVPSRLIHLDTMPHLANSKIDISELRRRAKQSRLPRFPEGD